MEDVKIIKAIGEGSFGTVYLAEYHNFPVACKVCTENERSRARQKGERNRVFLTGKEEKSRERKRIGY
jgi:predicted Ser/Thr protein kinase